MSTIFISHSSRDAQAAKELSERLAERGHGSIFLDFDPDKGIVAGQSWERTLYRKLRACRAVVALCSDHYLDSHWCFAEIALARMEGKHIIALKVDPLDESTKLPAILTDRQLIDLQANKEEGYERLWRGLAEQDILGTAGWNPKHAPYLGLDAYQEQHAPVFFGREEETQAGLELLDRGAPGLVMVLGSSGSGKSSLVRAGILPRLRRETADWLVVDTFRPGVDPFAELVESLVDTCIREAPKHASALGTREQIRARLEAGAASLPLGTVARIEPKEVGTDEPVLTQDERLRRLMSYLEDLREHPPRSGGEPLRGFLELSLKDLRRITGGHVAAAGPPLPAGSTVLTDLAEQLRRAAGRRDARVLLVVDQFEEVLLRIEDERANRFLALLKASLECDQSPLMALGTMRSDFLPAFQMNPALRGVDFATLSLGPMKIEGMRRVIEEPAKLGEIELESGLADRLLEDTETPDALPLLSFTLWVLWRDYREDGRLSIKEYEQLGGLAGAVAREASALLDAAKDEDMEAALRTAFVRMVLLTEDGRYARRTVPWDAAELRPVHSILERFIERRLLVSGAADGRRTVEVAHEALFRSWETLNTWLADHRAELLLRQQIARDAETWDAGGRATSDVWRGLRLQQARELRHRERLPQLEYEFVRAGLRYRQRKIARWVGGALVVLGLVAWPAVVAYREGVRSDDGLRITVARDWLERDPTRAALLLEKVVYPDDGRFAAASLEALKRGVASIFREGDRGTLKAWLSPDGSRRLSTAQDGSARLWKVGGAEREAPLVLGRGLDNVLSVEFSPDGRRVLTGSSDGTVRVWRADGSDRRQPVVLRGHDGEVGTAAWSPDGTRVLTASKDGTARIWKADGSDRDAPLVLRGHRGRVSAAAWSPDAKRVVTASQDGTARVWRADGSGEGAPLVLAGDPDGEVQSAVFVSDGARVLTTATDGTLRVWNAEIAPQSPIQRLVSRLWPSCPWCSVPSLVVGGPQDAVLVTAVGPDGRRLATAGADGALRVWDTDSPDGGRPVELAGHTGRILSMAWSPDGTRLAAACEDGMMRVWNADGPTAATVQALENGDEEASVAWSPDGRRVLTAADLRVHLWTLDGSDPDGPLVLASQDEIRFAEWSPDGARVLATDQQGRVVVWRADGSDRDDPLTLEEANAWTAGWSPDGSRVLTTAKDDPVRIWRVDVSEAEDPVVLSASWTVELAAFSLDGKQVLTASADGTARVWRTDGSGQGAPVVLEGQTNEYGEPVEIRSAAFSPGGSQVVTASWDGTPTLWEVDGGSPPVQLPGEPEDAILTVAFGPRGRRILAAYGDGTVRRWKADGSEPNEPAVEAQPLAEDAAREVQIAAFGPGAARVLTASADGKVQLWSADGSYPEDVAVLAGHRGDILSAAFSADGRRVLTVSGDRSARDAKARDGTVRVWQVDPIRSEPILIAGNIEDEIQSAAFSRDGNQVVTISRDGTLRGWQADGAHRYAPVLLAGPIEAEILSLGFAADGPQVLTGSGDGTIRVAKANGSEEAPLVLATQGETVSASLSANGEHVVTVSGDGTLRVWKVDGSDEGEPVVLEGRGVAPEAVGCDSTGRQVVTGSEDGTVRVWRADGRDRGAPLVFVGHRSTIVSAAFSPDGSRVVTASLDGTARVWNTDGSNRTEPLVLKGHRRDRILAAAFSPEGERVVTGSWDQKARVWQIDGSGPAIPVVLEGHRDQILSVAFSPDGSRVATASRDKTVRVWSADGSDSGSPLVLEGHTEAVQSVGFSRDGAYVVTASADGTVRRWVVAGELLQQQIRETTRAFR